MSYALSLLDKSPIARGETAADALERTAELARLAERAGFRRFWVAEHHNAPELASSAPEIVIAWLLARTSRIRIGSGGVMLQHYAPYKVAETFNLLASLAPARVDLGIGKAPGGLPLSTRALQGAYDPNRRPGFEQLLAELSAYLDDAGPEPGLSATPRVEIAAERFLLGASVDSAKLAATHGWEFVFARHLNGDDALLADTIEAYRGATGRAPLVAVAILIGESDAAARAQAERITLFKVHIPGAQSVTVGSETQALDYVRQAGASEFRIEPKAPSVVAGTAAHVLAELDRLHARFGIPEFIVESAAIGDDRLAAIDALARVRAAIPA